MLNTESVGSMQAKAKHVMYILFTSAGTLNRDESAYRTGVMMFLFNNNYALQTVKHMNSLFLMTSAKLTNYVRTAYENNKRNVCIIFVI